MSAPIDHAGAVFGCLTAVRKAATRRLPSGGVRAYWVVQCQCGRMKEMGAQSLKNRRHASCGADCSLRLSAIANVSCARCGAHYSIKRGSIAKGRGSQRLCTKCRSVSGANAVRGKPAHNRLKGDIGSFNLLLARYRAGAKARGLAFELDRDGFRKLTKSECHYCGAQPGQAIAGRKGDPTPYVYNGVDRIDSTRGYVHLNTVACCGVCNYMKGDMSYEDFMRHVVRIASRTQALPPASSKVGSTP